MPYLEYHVAEFSSFINLQQDIDRLQKKDFIILNCNATDKHFKYFEDYLRSIGAATVIVEPEYIDKNFMEDYSRYYSRCFKSYSKKCERLHFFSSGFNRNDFDKAVLDPDSHSDLQKHYLGFIVLRPLPDAQIGKVCLSVYPDVAERDRHFPMLREYTAHFMGLELTVSSIAFQEQDKAISACATAAIWSALHCLRHDSFSVSSPFEITTNAKEIISDFTESNFPTKGLLPSQMAHAMKKEGFEPILNKFVSTSYLKALVRAYLSANIPLTLCMKLRYADEQGETPDGKSRKLPIGKHAVTTVGYNIASSEIKPVNMGIGTETRINNKSFFLYSSKIDRLYVHDDQVGPFAKMEFMDENWQHIKTRWCQYSPHPEKIDATIESILISVNPKIRIRFATIFNLTREYSYKCTESWNKAGIRILWDIRLSTVCRIKEDFQRGGEDFSKDAQLKFLSMKMPRYVWIVDAHCYKPDLEDSPLVHAFSFYFDATDIDNADLFIGAVHHDADSYKLCCNDAASIMDIIDDIKGKIDSRIISILKCHANHNSNIICLKEEIADGK